MKYKLYTDKEYDSPIEQILCGRGMPQEQIPLWLEGNLDNRYDWRLLDEKKMSKAVCMVENTVQSNDNILVVVDDDCDGFCSAALFINYLYKRYKEYSSNHVRYFLHKGKQHGLATVEVPEDVKLVVVPDGGTNDIAQHKELFNRNIQVLVLDHHLQDQITHYALVINNQTCGYPNKEFSGAGIVYQFCRAYDELFFDDNIADDFMDLAAIGCAGDMMNYQSIETRSVIKNGLKRIRNPFILSMCDRNKFSINKKGGINYFSMVFYVVPFINAIVRSGTIEEKELVFQSMLLQYAFDEVESGKRGAKGSFVPRVEEGVRIAVNVKSRQTRAQNNALEIFEKKIEEQNLLQYPIILLLCEPGEVEPNLAGLVANKFQAKYQRPCAILTKTEQNGEIIYQGSARNYSMSEIQDFKAVCAGTGLTSLTAGHSNAFGLGIPATNTKSFLLEMESVYKNISTEPVYYVDYIWNQNTADGRIILDIANMVDFWSTGIPESRVCLRNIPLSNCSLTLMGVEKGNPTLKIMCGETEIIKFKFSEEEFEKLQKDNLYMTVICSCKRNEWNGNARLQLIIQDWEIKEEWRF